MHFVVKKFSIVYTRV